MCHILQGMDIAIRVSSTWATDSRSRQDMGAEQSTFLRCVFRHAWTYDPITRSSSSSSLQQRAGQQYCLSSLRLHYVFRYQPASHFWLLQTAEAAVFIVGALVLLRLAILLVQRWRT